MPLTQYLTNYIQFSLKIKSNKKIELYDNNLTPKTIAHHTDLFVLKT